jgi:CHASE3 domain sensor protein
MSKVYHAMMRAQRERDQTHDEPTLRDRLRGWIHRRRSAEVLETRPACEPLVELQASAPDDTAAALTGEIASLQVAVDALDDRISAEVVEREAKLLEEIRRGMRGLETELSDRFAAATLEMKRSSQRSAALVVVFVALLSGLVVGVLSRF